MTGVVLPVVLVVLTILTGLVVTQVRRSATDERLAANTRESVMMDSAVQTALRWCEWRVTGAPFNTKKPLAMEQIRRGRSPSIGLTLRSR